MRYKLMLMGLFLLTSFFLVRGAECQEGNRVYVYKDYTSPQTVIRNFMVMPARAAETNMVGIHPTHSPGFDGAGTCIQFVFNVQNPPEWAGVVFPVIQDYWGEWEANGWDLSKAKKLIFYAKGETGSEQIQIKAAITGDKPYGDSAMFPVVTDWIKLEREWKRYEVPVDGKQLKRVITPFVIVTNKPHNPQGTLTFYVDEIYYQMGE